jgi:hypothetical protein
VLGVTACFPFTQPFGLTTALTFGKKIKLEILFHKKGSDRRRNRLAQVIEKQDGGRLFVFWRDFFSRLAFFSPVIYLIRETAQLIRNSARHARVADVAKVSDSVEIPVFI